MLLQLALPSRTCIYNLSPRRIFAMTAAELSTITNGTAVPLTLDAKPLQLSDEEVINQKYRPFLLSEGKKEKDWVSNLELDAVTKFVEGHSRLPGYTPLKFLVLYGSLREW